MFKNNTPHVIRLQLPGGELLELAPTGPAARVATTTSEAPTGPVGGMPAVLTSFGKVYDLPAPEEGVVFIVSSLVLSAMEADGTLAERPDLWAPDTSPTGGAIRKDGQVWAVTRLTRPQASSLRAKIAKLEDDVLHYRFIANC